MANKVQRSRSNQREVTRLSLKEKRLTKQDVIKSRHFIKKVFVATAFAITSLVALSAPVQAANKEGGKCEKAGAATKVAGKKLVCRKQGKTLKWVAASGASSTAPGSCLVVPEKYCKSGKLIYSRMLGADAIAFKIPAETPVFAPYDGEFIIYYTRESETAEEYLLYMVCKMCSFSQEVPAEFFNAVFIPSLKSSTEEIATKISGTKIVLGTLIGYASGENIYSMDYPNESYNLIITFKKKGVQRSDEWNLDPAMKKLFKLR